MTRFTQWTRLVAVCLAYLAHLALVRGAEPLPRLRVSDNHRFLVTETGQPFCWLADTAWELFHRLDRNEAEHYLNVRAQQGFNVIQAVAIGELDGHEAPNAYGHLPLVELDPARPAIVDGDQNDYWDHVDFIVAQANARGIYVAMLPTWGRFWHDPVRNDQPLLTPVNARTYGRWLGARYRHAGIVWVLGGDRNVENDSQRQTLRELAAGLHDGDGHTHLMTFHPRGGEGSAQHFHAEPWLDFNLRQNGHHVEFNRGYQHTRADYDRSPPKPVIDGEPVYEDHPIAFRPDEQGHSVAADVRRALYWDLFSGACGHTYGHHSVWQMWQPGRAPINRPLLPWSEAIYQPGATQMRFGRQLLESRPFLSRVPDDQMLVGTPYSSAVPGHGRYRYCATRDSYGSYAFVYVPVGRPVTVRLSSLQGTRLNAWWYNPRTGEAATLGEFERTDTRTFSSPTPGEALDWVLVLDDASRHYPPPGSR